ncbi:MAG: hypothetical protein MjAS7_2042 [Metallosphaera javensis (ex Sakai et al. 2022)]|nr:MAG: hypothetical protein MjAS7_2042 [Metallosphaera javensis (ex Sakai et al. 2022)]
MASKDMNPRTSSSASTIYERSPLFKEIISDIIAIKATKAEISNLNLFSNSPLEITSLIMTTTKIIKDILPIIKRTVKTVPTKLPKLRAIMFTILRFINKDIDK